MFQKLASQNLWSAIVTPHPVYKRNPNSVEAHIVQTFIFYSCSTATTAAVTLRRCKVLMMY